MGWLTIDRDGTTVRAVLHTVVHRRPRDLPVSIATASRLIAAGAPVVLRGFAATRSGNAA